VPLTVLGQLRRRSCAATLLAPLALAAQEPPSAAIGRALYAEHCERCHGVDLVYAGMSFDLRTFPQDQPERFKRSVAQGTRAMPAWGKRLTPGQIESLWLYVSAGR
jgi:cytochrome c55X